MANRLTISIAQIPVVTNDPGANVETAARAIGEGARRGSNLVVLPELWTTGADLRAPTADDTPARFDAVAAMRDLALTDHVALAGSVLLREGERFYNTFLLVDGHGELLGRYRKIHVFKPMDEHRYVTPGDEIVTADAPWGRTGLAICYDLRFPELFRCLTDRGARLVIVPAEWPHPRLEHWRTLTRARAIENLCFVVTANAAGRQESYHFCGHSAVIDPWGATVAEAGEDPTVLMATIDLDEVDRVRERFPALQDRRTDLF